MGLNRRLAPLMGTEPPVSPGNPLVGRVAVIAGLEGKVSLLQVAKGGIGRIQLWLGEIRTFLEEAPSKDAPMAPSVANQFLEDRLRQIEGITQAVSFAGRALLNGKSGITGAAEGAGLQFVRGSARTLSSIGKGYPVSIDETARPASLLGTQPAVPSVLAQERWITLKEGGVEARYKVLGHEEPKELVYNLQRVMEEAGLDITVFLTRDQRLLFLHNQLGSGPKFEGTSQATRLVSGLPGEPMPSMAGRDLIGSIGTEPAQGSGAFLVGNRGNARTEGLIVYYDGPVQYPGQVVGYVTVTQNGILVPLDLKGQEVELLSLPQLSPSTQAIGVRNPSGFQCLSQIRAGSAKERWDAHKLVLRALADLSELAEELKWKEEVYVQKALDLLRQNPAEESATKALLGLSTEKAQQMALDLKTLFKKLA
ncbi:MAG: hypothetical protein A2600_06570 [Candidatus Lambdaproteobacteria bacterium RIFOXYD1_FULL_56_27]|nr:MAG: hypothetical protein A2426_05985 [Candidatus Lambdaproteobacteria bacterium RIFOXYC1_FULL_56_13]OGH08998.1 MAG: hypothetical protein A2600_06570 [Candidatus Lambdaproteobacteria bacterium RIFOXYD1_FULL_56_27]